MTSGRQHGCPDPGGGPLFLPGRSLPPMPSLSASDMLADLASSSPHVTGGCMISFPARRRKGWPNTPPMPQRMEARATTTRAPPKTDHRPSALLPLKSLVAASSLPFGRGVLFWGPVCLGGTGGKATGSGWVQTVLGGPWRWGHLGAGLCGVPVWQVHEGTGGQGRRLGRLPPRQAPGGWSAPNLLP